METKFCNVERCNIAKFDNLVVTLQLVTIVTVETCLIPRSSRKTWDKLSRTCVCVERALGGLDIASALVVHRYCC